MIASIVYTGNKCWQLLYWSISYLFIPHFEQTLLILRNEEQDTPACTAIQPIPCLCLHIRSTSAQHSLWHCIPRDLLACSCQYVRTFTPPNTTGLYWCVTRSSAMLGAQRRRIWAVCLWTWVFWLVYCANGTHTLQDTNTPRTTEVFYTHFSFVFTAL